MNDNDVLCIITRNKTHAEVYAALLVAYNALKFYANLPYDHRMGLPPEVQWVAENALKKMNEIMEITY